MAIVSMQLDPNAASYTDDQIVGKINNASAQITRADSVAAAARPIADSEITDAKLAAGAIKTKLAAETDGNKLVSASLAAAAGITNAQVTSTLAKDNLDALADTERGYIKTGPTTGEFKVVSIQRDATGKLDVDYDNVEV
jgi:hypothetical protein